MGFIKQFKAGRKAGRGAAVPLMTAVTVLAAAMPCAAFGDDLDPQVARGRYLVQIAGCNDCHTPGYMESAGGVDEALWLTGNPVGWTGPWGTTYPPNLRLLADKLPEGQWLSYARRTRGGTGTVRAGARRGTARAGVPGAVVPASSAVAPAVSMGSARAALREG